MKRKHALLAAICSSATICGGWGWCGMPVGRLKNIS